jgi:hypothetical protein
LCPKKQEQSVAGKQGLDFLGQRRDSCVIRHSQTKHKTLVPSKQLEILTKKKKKNVSAKLLSKQTTAPLPLEEGEEE